MTTSHVYIISSGPYLKIGKANNVEGRRREIQCGNPMECKIEHVVPVPASAARYAESLVHAALADYRHMGEWFHIEVDAARAAVEKACAEARQGREPDSDEDYQRIGVELAKEVLTGMASTTLTEQDRWNYAYTYRTDFESFSVEPLSINEAKRLINWRLGEPKPEGTTPKMTRAFWLRKQEARKRWLDAQMEAA